MVSLCRVKYGCGVLVQWPVTAARWQAMNLRFVFITEHRGQKVCEEIMTRFKLCSLTVQKILLERWETVWNGLAPFCWSLKHTVGNFERHDRDITAHLTNQKFRQKHSNFLLRNEEGSSCHRADLHQHDITCDLPIKNCHETGNTCKVVELTESCTLLALVSC